MEYIVTICVEFHGFYQAPSVYYMRLIWALMICYLNVRGSMLQYIKQKNDFLCHENNLMTLYLNKLYILGHKRRLGHLELKKR